MFKKAFFCLVLFSLSAFVFGENKSGVVIDKITQGQSVYVLIDTNKDKIADACVILTFSPTSGVHNAIISSYIKIGGSIVININGNPFYLSERNIISINGTLIENIAPKNFWQNPYVG